jgi:hypothetical protein
VSAVAPARLGRKATGGGFYSGGLRSIATARWEDEMHDFADDLGSSNGFGVGCGWCMDEWPHIPEFTDVAEFL